MISQLARDLVVPGGTIVLEHAEGQGAAIRALLAADAWRDPETLPDLTGAYPRDHRTEVGWGVMAEVFDCSDNSQLLAGMRSARQALGRALLAVIPTDTVYGLAADAFSAAAVRKLLNAKGRSAKSPPPVLIATPEQLDALTAEVPSPVHRLADELWPGALTIVLKANPALSWHLGETGGTVALRIPDQELALELLRETGPLAVSSANKTGKPAARTMQEARDALGGSVAVYLDSGQTAGDGERRPSLTRPT